METISTRLRLPAALYTRLKTLADREHRSLHNLIIHLLEQSVREAASAAPLEQGQ